MWLIANTDFFVVHLPLPQHMAHVHNGGQSPYRYLLDYLRETYLYIPFDESLGPEYMEERVLGTDRALWRRGRGSSGTKRRLGDFSLYRRAKLQPPTL